MVETKLLGMAARILDDRAGLDCVAARDVVCVSIWLAVFHDRPKQAPMKQWMTQGNDIRYGRTISGQGALVQRHEHMLSTDPGDLLSDPEWGKKLKSMLGQAAGDTSVLEDVFRAQHLRDAETENAEVSIRYENGRLDYSATITAKNGTVTTVERTIVE